MSSEKICEIETSNRVIIVSGKKFVDREKLSQSPSEEKPLLIRRG